MSSDGLDWPAGFDRTPAADRIPYPHSFRVSRTQAFDNVVEQLDKLDGAANVRVATAAPHTSQEPHRPYADRDPDDPGVVVRFDRDGQGYAIPCDRWDSLRDNAQAIAKYVDAKRAVARYGVETTTGEFATQALPSGDEEAIAVDPEPHEVLEVRPDAPPAVVRGAARSLLKDDHPDTGGDGSAIGRIKAARDAMLADERGEQW
jgi:hypothetical protein